LYLKHISAAYSVRSLSPVGRGLGREGSKPIHSFNPSPHPSPYGGASLFEYMRSFHF
jgi:hypothetical protein